MGKRMLWKEITDKLGAGRRRTDKVHCTRKHVNGLHLVPFRHEASQEIRTKTAETAKTTWVKSSQVRKATGKKGGYFDHE